LLDVQVTVYDVTALPLPSGAVKATTKVPFPRVTEGAAGMSGTAAGITAADGGDDGLVPTAFVAVMVHV
jgi:hypothetical protein